MYAAYIVVGIYAAYIAEIRPANHLYSLSLETTFYILLQFVYANESTMEPNAAVLVNTSELSSTPFDYVPVGSTTIHLVVIRHMECKLSTVLQTRVLNLPPVVQYCGVFRPT